MLHVVLQMSSLKRWKKAASTRKKSVTWNMRTAAWGVSWYWQVRVGSWPFVPWLSVAQRLLGSNSLISMKEAACYLPSLQFNKSTSLVCHSSIEAMSGASAGTLHKILWQHKVHHSDYTGRSKWLGGFSPENVETSSSLLLPLSDGFGLGWFNMQAFGKTASCSLWYLCFGVEEHLVLL